MRRALIPIAVLGILMMAFWRALQVDPTEIGSPLIDQPAPALQLPVLGDPEARFDLAALRGQVLLVNVWGSWCVGCHQEHDMLMRIAREDLVPIIGLNWKDEAADALRFLAEGGDPYRLSAQDLDGRVAIDWGVYGAPETFLVDADGIIRFKYIGPIDEAVWQEELRPRVLALLAGGEA